MALATQCPYCRTTFRVAQDQLKLRAGLVRCGNCKEIFNGVEHLLRPEAPVEAPPPVIVAKPIPAPPEQPVEAEKSSAALDFFDLFDQRPTELTPALAPPAEPPAPPPPKVPPAPAAEIDPLHHRMTLMVRSEDAHSGAKQDHTEQSSTDASEEDLSAMLQHTDEEVPDTQDPLALAIEDLQRKPLRGTKEAASRKKAETPEPLNEHEEPSFVKSDRRRQRLSRGMRILMGFTSFVLLLSLLGQGAYIFRNQIAARWPQAKPLLLQGCEILGCSVGLPAQIEAVSIESNELQALPANKDIFVLSILLRNHSQTIQAWPNIELTLIDTNEKAIARRIFTPRDYVPAAHDVAKGIGAVSEQSIKILFELSQLKAAGYRVYLFYP